MLFAEGLRFLAVMTFSSRIESLDAISYKPRLSWLCRSRVRKGAVYGRECKKPHGSLCRQALVVWRFSTSITVHEPQRKIMRFFIPVIRLSLVKSWHRGFQPPGFDQKAECCALTCREMSRTSLFDRMRPLATCDQSMQSDPERVNTTREKAAAQARSIKPFHKLHISTARSVWGMVADR